MVEKEDGVGAFDGKAVAVTGAASGFGAATARRFASMGAKVLLADVNERGAQRLAAEIGGHAVAMRVDVRLENDVADMVRTVEERFGGLDVLISNAGLCGPMGVLESSLESDFDLMFDVNVKGVWLGLKYGAAAMRRRGGGVILHTASVAALAPRPRAVVYGASKAAVVGLTRAAALELAPLIRVNCVCPASADTPFMANAVDDPAELAHLRENLTEIAGVPLGRLAVPEDVAQALTFLASPQASYLSGVVLPVDGARSAA